MTAAIRIAIVSTFPPRACGIATFSADLHDALAASSRIGRVDIVAVTPGDEPYGPPVVATIDRGTRADYMRAARTIGRLGVDAVMIEHEFGIFGGDDGELVLDLVDELRVPYAVTLHTVLTAPSESQRAALTDLCRGAGAVFVFTETARRLVVAQRIADPGRIHVVPHGAPQVICDVARRAARSTRLPLGSGPPMDVAHRFVLSSFGLLSPGKGLETVLDAVAKLAPAHPEVLLVVAGRTHPEVARHEGERYRIQLHERMHALDLDRHVVFDDRFLRVDELAELLDATDLYVTAYPSSEQIVSGTLTFAVAAGRPVVSTPYLYATDLLGGGAGRLTPFGDAAALAANVEELIERPDQLAALRRAARQVGACLSWPAVGEATAAILEHVASPPAAPAPRATSTTTLPPQRSEHLRTLVDDVGIIQHARGVVPDRATGYCVDDVARLLQVASRLDRLTGDQWWRATAQRALAFLWHATSDDAVGMRNFMAYDRRWLDEPDLGDHVGRSVWALGDLLAAEPPAPLVEPAERLLALLCTHLAGDAPLPLRTRAYALLGLARAGRDESLIDRLAASLVESYRAHRDEHWEWFEPVLTYDNARLAQALIVAGTRRRDRSITEVGLRTLHWLGERCCVATTLRLPGNGWCRRDEAHPGAGDEQPLDAAALVEAEIDAMAATGNVAHGERGLAAFAWFTGRNRLGVPVYDAATGGCRDGLAADHVNTNEGAESTLAYHTARLAIEAAGLGILERVARVA